MLDYNLWSRLEYNSLPTKLPNTIGHYSEIQKGHSQAEAYKVVCLFYDKITV